MTAVPLTIVEPKHASVFTDPTQVTLQGHPVGTPPAVPLYYRWYSDLHPGPKQDEYALAIKATDPVDPRAARAPNESHGYPLGPGTHVLTFAVTDQATETKDALLAVRHGGVAGGSRPPHPCVVHVLRAAVHVPGGGVLSLGLGSATIDMVGPVLWGDPDYMARNRLGYSFRFTPLGRTDTVEIVPRPDQLARVAPPPAAPSLVRFAGRLALPRPGSYTLRLRAFDLTDPTIFHESDPVSVVAS
ncbi:MAG: hypothetical protein LC720_04355 [Actinobacteria bacterium]|nr:hypothetical protein [Actinomycetota bacterium]